MPLCSQMYTSHAAPTPPCRAPPGVLECCATVYPDPDLLHAPPPPQGAHFYVCGDASSMAGSVEKELLAIFQARLGGADAAAAYLDKLSKEERYQRDVWY